MNIGNNVSIDTGCIFFTVVLLIQSLFWTSTGHDVKSPMIKICPSFFPSVL